MNKDVIYNGILLSHKRKWNNPTCSTMDGPRDYHTKWSKSDKERQRYHLHVESKKVIQRDLCTMQKVTHRHRKQTYDYQRGKVWEE